MKKIILNLNEAENKEQVQDYIAKTFGFGPKFGKNLDALYDELTSISEPTAIGIFMPMGDMMDLDFDYMLYIDKLCETFAEAEEDNSALAVIYGDLPLNDGFEDAYDGIFDDDDDFDDYTGERIGRRGNIRPFADDYFEDDADAESEADADMDSEEDSDLDSDIDLDVPGDHDVVLLDINKFRR